MDEEPVSDDSSELIHYTEHVDGKAITVSISREAIEDYLRRESLSESERQAFVTQNRKRLTKLALQHVTEGVRGVTLTSEMLNQGLS